MVWYASDCVCPLSKSPPVFIGVVYDCFDCPGGVFGEQEGQLAVITRTNFELFKEAVIKCVYSDKKYTVAFAGVRNDQLLADVYLGMKSFISCDDLF